MAIQILQDVSLGGGLLFLDDKTDFPDPASVGMLVLKEQCLYARIKIGQLETWYPFANKTRSYIHVQGAPATTWTVAHNLGSTDIWIQVLSETGNIINVSKTDVDANSFTLNFTAPTVGKVVVVAPESINVPTVSASTMNIGNNVQIDSTGVKVNGSYLLSGADLSSKQDTLVSGTNIKTINGNSVLGSGDIVTGDVTTTGSQTLTNKTVESVVLNKGFTEQVTSYNASGATTISSTLGSIHRITLTGNATISSTIPAGSSVLLMINDGTGYAITWPTMTWIKSGGSGTAPALNTTTWTCVLMWNVAGALYGTYLGDA